MRQRFTEEEAQEILRRAVHAPQDGGYTTEELLRSAAEIGVSPDAVAWAVAETRAEGERREFETAHRKKAGSEIARFAALAAALVVADLAISPRDHWVVWAFVWVVLSWGIMAASSLLALRNRRGEGYRRAFESWRDKSLERFNVAP